MRSVRGAWIDLKSSLWFIPALCVLFAVGLAVGLADVDYQTRFGLARRWPQFFGLSAQGSRSILATIAQSVVTIAGVTFSITIVALSLAANQYTPRVLRNFMRDRGNQVVLGGLMGIFTYCIIVVRTVHGGEDPFVPAISVMVALALAIGAVGLFVYFIDHVAKSIQASTIICSIAEETEAVIRIAFPGDATSAAREWDLTPEEQLQLSRMEWQEVALDSFGYLQSMDQPGLIAFARKHGTVVKIEHAIGDFVIQGKPIVSVGRGLGKPKEEIVQELNRLFTVHSYRTIDQDVSFGLRQIVDIAVKALSPGINDPTTAMTCLDYLGAVITMLIRRHTPARCHYEEGRLLLVTKPRSFEELLDLAFDEIRQNSSAQPVVLLGLLTTLERIATTQGIVPERQKMLARHTGMVLEFAEQKIRFPLDLKRIRDKAAAVQALHRPEASCQKS